MKSIVLSSAAVGIVLGAAIAVGMSRLPARAPVAGVGVAGRAAAVAANMVPVAAVGANHGGQVQPLGNEMPCKTGYVDPESGGIPELFGGRSPEINGEIWATPRPTARAGGSGVRFP